MQWPMMLTSESGPISWLNRKVFYLHHVLSFSIDLWQPLRRISRWAAGSLELINSDSEDWLLFLWVELLFRITILLECIFSRCHYLSLTPGLAKISTHRYWTSLPISKVDKPSFLLPKTEDKTATTSPETRLEHINRHHRSLITLKRKLTKKLRVSRMYNRSLNTRE